MLLFAAVAGWWASGPASDEVTVYKATCENDINIRPMTHSIDGGKNFSEEYKKYRQDRMSCILLHIGNNTYKVNSYRSEVYYQYRLLGGGPKRLVNCAIMDSNNWRCEYPNGKEHIAVINGLYAWDKDSSHLNSFSLYRWQYWYVTWYRFIMGKGPQGAWLIPEQEALN